VRHHQTDWDKDEVNEEMLRPMRRKTNWGIVGERASELWWMCVHTSVVTLNNNSQPVDKLYWLWGNYMTQSHTTSLECWHPHGHSSFSMWDLLVEGSNFMLLTNIDYNSHVTVLLEVSMNLTLFFHWLLDCCWK